MCNDDFNAIIMTDVFLVFFVTRYYTACTQQRTPKTLFSPSLAQTACRISEQNKKHSSTSTAIIIIAPFTTNARRTGALRNPWLYRRDMKKIVNKKRRCITAPPLHPYPPSPRASTSCVSQSVFLLFMYVCIISPTNQKTLSQTIQSSAVIQTKKNPESESKS